MVRGGGAHNFFFYDCLGIFGLVLGTLICIFFPSRHLWGMARGSLSGCRDPLLGEGKSLRSCPERWSCSIYLDLCSRLESPRIAEFVSRPQVKCFSVVVCKRQKVSFGLGVCALSFTKAQSSTL